MRRDLFSDVAREYARFRPAYPPELFAYLASVAPATARVWDCATGNGQAAAGLAQAFGGVAATDGSREQIAAARRRERIVYAVAAAESAPFADASFHVVTVAQAVHWFDLRRFYHEARRVLVPGGVLAIWCYQLMRVGSGVDDLLDAFHDDRVGAYWPPERRLVDEGYRALAFPFAERSDVPTLSAVVPWNLRHVAGYLGTWSAVRRYRDRTGTDPVVQLLPELAGAWGAPDAVREVRFPLALRVGHR